MAKHFPKMYGNKELAFDYSISKPKYISVRLPVNDPTSLPQEQAANSKCFQC